MCYTPKTSLYSFLINFITSLLLLNKSNIDKNNELKIIAYFFMFVGLMQFYDYIFWTTKDIEKNKLFTKIAMITNHLQPIILGLLIYHYTKNIENFSKTILIIYFILILLYSINIWNTLTTTKVTPESSPSLNWEWNHGKNSEFVYILFLLALVLLFYKNFSNKYKYLLAVITIFSFFFSVYKYQFQLSSGRFWCYFAAFTPVIFLLY
jgi:hypothetical protein